ncbi:MAG: ATP-binding protein [Candidatus Omnitrophota bacterium]
MEDICLKYRILLETIPDIVYELDKDGHFTFVNSAIQVLGYEPGELIGIHFASIIHPEDVNDISRDRVLPHFRGKVTGDNGSPKLFDERRTKRRMTMNLVARVIHKEWTRDNEKFIYGELHSSGKWSMDVNEKEKELVGSIGIIRDITQRKNAEAEIARLAMFPELNPNAVVELDVDGNVTYLNPAAKTRFSDLYSLGIRHPLLRDFAVILAELQQGEKAYTVREAGFNRRTYEMHISYIPKARRLRVYVSDITERKEIENLKDEFISTVSHELRTPLSISKEGISLVLDRITGDINEKQEKILKTAKSNMDRLARIINSLLDISKIESGKVELKRARVNLVDLVRRTASNFENAVKDKGLKLELFEESDTIDVYADADGIVSVLTNLIGNSLKFTQEGRLSVSVSADGSRAVCTVADTGIGISAEDIPHLFDKFRQFGRTAGAGDKGTGLGLSIAKGLVDMHGGNMRAESTPGKGTSITFSLPLYSDELKTVEKIRANVREANLNEQKLSLLMVTVRDIQTFEERFGAAELEKILSGIEEVIMETIRPSDMILEKPGEILIVVNNCNARCAESIKRRLAAAVEERMEVKNAPAGVSILVGVATYPDDGGDVKSLISKARRNI